ncbi:F-box protein [Aspergillus ibericus CBS 121593]|uniref:F-box domain protein n=1 Tax=Aspergillus ibericus CBS 121593 TaxID=1448316 RepID=A0A395H6E9_9EURO|nr:F-box domain protein [Aspergillus ibericus CBS 121593]RAL02438.1 F-box domain protein [Aspergillus ibericus CBS 121593]
MDWQSSHGIPLAVVDRLLHYIPHDSRSALRLTCKPWCRAIDKVTPLRRPVANTLPAEILLQIFHRLAPRDFDNARRTCSQWMRVSLDRDLLQRMLKRAGWWDSWLRDCQSSSLVVGEEESSVWKMSKRFATECLLSGRKVNVERPGFLTTAVVDFSQLSQRQRAAEFRRPSQPVITEIEPQTHVDGTPLFHVSDCGRYLLVASNRIISVYRLLSMRADFSTSPDADVALVARITCPAEVMATTIDTSSLKLTVAALLHSRLGMVCDLVPATDGPCADLRRTKYAMELVSRHFIYNVCSANDPPQSVSICPGRRCVAFGSGTGFELRWINGQTNQDCRKQFPMSQPSEVLHFFPSRPNAPRELRIISSLAGPGLPGCSCHGVHDGGKRPKCPFHLSADVQSLTRWDPQHNGDPDLVRATHCHNYHAIPINDGLHVLYVEPRTGHLCIGSDAPIGGPTSLTKTFVCVPPFDNSASEGISEGMAPTVFAAGSDLSWGLRVVAAYQDRLVLYSVPLDVFNVIRKERERQGDGVMGDSDLARDWFLDNQRSRKRRDSLVQNQNGDWEFLLSVSYRPTAMMWPFQIYGKEIGRVNDVVELALQSSNGGARIWAFDASGKTNVIDVDTFTSTAQPAADIPCKSVSVDTDGTVSPAQLVDRSVLEAAPQLTRKRKHYDQENFSSQHTNAHWLDAPMLREEEPSELSQLVTAAATKRRYSFAACIVDLNIPELNAREGPWVEDVSVM